MTDDTTLHELERESGDDLASRDYWAQTRTSILVEWIQSQSPTSILDAGCGSGYLTAVLASETDADVVVGADISEESIDVAQRRDSTAAFHVADVTDLSSWAETYDAIVFADVLEHFSEPETILAPAREALSKGGSIYVTLPAHQWLWGPHDEHNDHHARYDTSSLEALAGACDLHPVRMRYTNLVPLIPYWVFQRVLKRPVPDGTRGGHNAVVEAVKTALIGFERRIDPPAGVTLLGELRA